MVLGKTSKEDKRPSDWGFKLMALEFKVRDFLRPRKRVLEEVGIKPGYQVLDYGCGPGSYVTAMAELVGKTGKVYALDSHPLTIKMVKNIISKKHLTNVETILSECATGLPENSLDAVLLYDILHDLADPNRVLEEIHRIMKSNGVLSLSDHHLKELEMVSKVTEKGLFKPVSKGKRTYTFGKQQIK